MPATTCRALRGRLLTRCGRYQTAHRGSGAEEASRVEAKDAHPERPACTTLP